MLKIKVLFLLFPLTFLTSCNSSNIDIPNSPFKDDNYKRIGMTSIYQVEETINSEEYNLLLNQVESNNNKTDFYAKEYTRVEEVRDLKYAYFGKETSSVFFNSLLSQSVNATRFNNNVNISATNTIRKLQMVIGDNNSKETSSVYTFDSGYKGPSLANKYQIRTKTKKNDEPEEVSQTKEETEYKKENENNIFSIRPHSSIMAHFSNLPEFKIMNGKAVYGKTKDGRYLIKEAYSKFEDFQTTVGRTYKSVNNYFYETILRKIQDKDKTYLCYDDFRFYQEKLILSDAFDGTGVPVLYLEKPVLVEYSETKYHIDYEHKGPKEYLDDIPEVSK